MMHIRHCDHKDISAIARVHSETFIRQRNSVAWVTCTLRAFPRFRYFVAETIDGIVGYIVWAEKSGFRDEVVLELEQIAVLPSEQGRGIGRALICESLLKVDAAVRGHSATIKAVLVTTRADNAAQHLYRATLGAEVQATIANLYSADEVVMVAHDPLATLHANLESKPPV